MHKGSLTQGAPACKSANCGVVIISGTLSSRFRGVRYSLGGAKCDLTSCNRSPWYCTHRVTQERHINAKKEIIYPLHGPMSEPLSGPLILCLTGSDRIESEGFVWAVKLCNYRPSRICTPGGFGVPVRGPFCGGVIFNLEGYIDPTYFRAPPFVHPQATLAHASPAQWCSCYYHVRALFGMRAVDIPSVSVQRLPKKTCHEWLVKRLPVYCCTEDVLQSLC